MEDWNGIGKSSTWHQQYRVAPHLPNLFYVSRCISLLSAVFTVDYLPSVCVGFSACVGCVWLESPPCPRTRLSFLPMHLSLRYGQVPDYVGLELEAYLLREIRSSKAKWVQVRLSMYVW